MPSALIDVATPSPFSCTVTAALLNTLVPIEVTIELSVSAETCHSPVGQLLAVAPGAGLSRIWQLLISMAKKTVPSARNRRIEEPTVGSSSASSPTPDVRNARIDGPLRSDT